MQSTASARPARPGLRAGRLTPWLAIAALAGLLAGHAAHAAGTVEVRYVTPEKFTDIGFGSFARERSLDGLTDIFERLGRHLPDGQTLRVEVLDVDLAGEVRPAAAQDYRIVRGGVDWPQVTFRYTLLEKGKALRSGEERLRDLNYLYARRGLSAAGTNLPYEKRMLDNWFRTQFMQAQ